MISRVVILLAIFLGTLPGYSDEEKFHFTGEWKSKTQKGTLEWELTGTSNYLENRGYQVEMSGVGINDPYGESTITGKCIENETCTLTQVYSSGSLAGSTYVYQGKPSFRKWQLVMISGKYGLSGEKPIGTFLIRH